jgi:hypothetical protein
MLVEMRPRQRHIAAPQLRPLGRDQRPGLGDQAAPARPRRQRRARGGDARHIEHAADADHRYAPAEDGEVGDPAPLRREAHERAARAGHHDGVG